MNGIDISNWQAGIMLENISADFVICKATQSTGYISPDFKRQMERAIHTGKRVGAYHYAGGGNPEREAQHFLNIVKPYIGKAILVLDWEKTQNAAYGYGADSWAKRFLDYVKSEVGITGFLYISAGIIGQFPNTLNAYRLWAAQYPNYNPIRGYLETPWNEGAYKCDIRQYTSMLYLSGWAGRLDGNKAYITGEEWDALAAGETPEEDAPTVDELAQEVLNGKWGNGQARKDALEAAGYDYAKVQERVNILVADEEITALAQAVIRGEYGNGDERKQKLGAKYEAVQKRVNKILGF
jgi:GH25 family lysozyme M1 (1,4-beta-N-acetylmuramidase)